MRCFDFDVWGQHARLFPLVVVATVVYVIGIPVLFGALLWRRRKVKPAFFALRCRKPPAVASPPRVRSTREGLQGPGVSREAFGAG